MSSATSTYSSSTSERLLAWVTRVVLVLLVAVAPRSVWAGPAEPELVQPVLKNRATLEYPPELLERPSPPAGRVTIKLTVGTDGVPKELEIEESLDPVIDAAAIEAVAKLRYEPGRLGDRPVEIVMRIALDVAPPKPPPEPKPKPKPIPEVEPDEPEPAARDVATQPVRIHGRVLEAGQRQPVGGARVLAIPAPAGAKVGHVRKKIYEKPSEPEWQVQTTTDAEGGFKLRGIPNGLVRVIILSEGFERLEFIESLPANQAISVKYYQTRLNTNPYRTVVRQGREQREEVARRTISVEEITSLPGTQGDALKSIQNFPGIARSPFGIGLLVIRGAAPTDSATYLAYHEIPQLFHFGGITSVFNSDILTQIDFIPGNFDSRYGDAIGGVINVAPRKGRRDGYHGYVDSDLFDTGVLVEGPVGKGSFILSGRRSYIDLLLPVFIPDDAGLDLTLAPRYYDYQALLDYPISGGDFSFRVFGSDDRLKLVTTGPNEIETDDRNQFETTVFFHRVDLAYRKRHKAWDFLITPSFRHDSFDIGISDLFRAKVKFTWLSNRAELSRQLSKRAAIRIGTEVLGGWFSFDAAAPPIPDMESGSTSERFETDTKDTFFSPALYTTLTLAAAERFTLFPGVRVQHYSAPFNRASVDPRLRAAWDVAEKTTLKAGVGLYSQAPIAPEFNDTWGNPRLSLERSLHTSLGVAQAFPYAITLEVTGFYKYLWDLASPSDLIVERPDGTVGPEIFASQETGRIYGAELLARKDITGKVFGWVSYTLMRSERKPAPGEDFILFNFDQTHILTLIGVYKLPKHWQVGARFRLVSGNLQTPVVGATYDQSGGFYIPINGAPNSERLPMFHQLDIRVDKRWIWKRTALTIYLDVQNVYNHQNTEFYQYSYDFSQRSPIASLPIIPSLGLKFEF